MRVVRFSVPSENTEELVRRRPEKRKNLLLSAAVHRNLRGRLHLLTVELLIAATALIATTTFAQSSSDSPSPRNSSIVVNARLVVLDVVATDPSGHSVNGLTAKDFQVFEDGKLQRMRSLELPTDHSLPSASVAAGVSEVFNPAQPATFGRSPVNILVLDQLNTHFADSSFARTSLHNYLTSQPPQLPQPTT